MTAFSDSHPINLLFNSLYSDNIFWHKKSENDITSSGLSYTILRPGAIKEIEYEYVNLVPERTKPPATIGVDNLANVIYKRYYQAEINSKMNLIHLRTKLFKCKGYNTRKGLVKKGVLSLLHH